MNRRFDILDGNLYPPQQIAELVDHPEFDNLFQSLWHNYLMKAGSTTSGTYWSDKFNDNKAFNRALYHLSKAGWIVSHTIPMRNWSTITLDPSKLLKWVSEDELITIRKTFKFKKYRMSHRSSNKINLTKTPKGILDVGLSRPGIARSGNNEFKYDTDYISKYYNTLVLNTTKSIEKAINKHQLVLDGADYKSISIEILDYHLYSKDESFTLGDSLSDSRGRAISESLSKVFNPIGYKDARALLIGPECNIDDSYDEIYLSVAELAGKKPKTIDEKIELGKQCCITRYLPELNLDTEEGRADLHEVIWLERIYDMLDNYNGSNWNVPLEIDAGSSVLQVMGILTGDYKMLNATNVINSEELEDAWLVKGLARKKVKVYLTPSLYGSSAPIINLWKSNNLTYTAKDIKLMDRAAKDGKYAVAVALKDYIIDNVEPQPEMEVTIMDETFKIYCNKYMNVGDYVKKYPLYDTATDSVLNVNHTHTNRVADLGKFKTYFVTLLVHNLDSQIADYVAEKSDWLLPIYDAFIIMPNEAKKTKESYTQIMNKIYARKEEILTNYFNSINIKKTVGSVKQFDKLKSLVTPIENFACRTTALR